MFSCFVDSLAMSQNGTLGLSATCDVMNSSEIFDKTLDTATTTKTIQ